MLDSKTVTCTLSTIVGKKRNSSYFDINDRCHDCNIVNSKGNYHHLGCDIERCNLCGDQLITCGCYEL